ncbi:MAG: HAMP domain-containing histidine kinase [Salinibacterium sp.]|nr:HAMP domain-containing histidine kinase [Salinibacterium sp.]
MRERLIAVFVGLTVAIVALYGIPRAYFVAELTINNEQTQVARSAQIIAIAVTELESRADPVTSEFLTKLAAADETLQYRSRLGDTTASREVYPASDTDIQVSIDLRNGSTITLTRSAQLVSERVIAAVTPVILIGLALIVLSVAVGFWLARRLARPFQQLAGLAGSMGTGRFDADVPRFKVREAQEIAHALHASDMAVGVLLRRQTEFAANVSHQLRTPLTALRLELEDLTLWPETPEGIRNQLTRSLGQVDRLANTVTELLEIARGEQLSGVDDVSLVDILRAAARRWTAVVRGERRVLRVSSVPPTVAVRVAAGPLHQVLDVLIENALRHGSGEIELSSRDAGTHVEITVRDQGERPMGQSIFLRNVRGESSTGEGIGLAVAKELTEAVGGHLRLDDTPGTSFTLMLPKPAAPSGGQPPAAPEISAV